MLHEFTFEGNYPVEKRVYNSYGTDFATLNGPIFFNGKACFYSSANPIPNIHLPDVSLGTSRVISVEAWISFDASNPAGSTLFSFGYPGRIRVSFTNSQQFAGKYYHMVVIINPGQPGYTKVYLNSTLVETKTIAVPSLTANSIGAEALVDNYIGRNVDSMTPGLLASLYCFRIWSGELSDDTIKSHVLLGYISNRIAISAEMTSTGNVNVAFLATSMQMVSVTVARWYPYRLYMLDSGMVFNFQALPNEGTTCSYSFQVALKNDGSSVVVTTVPAINFTITLDSTAQLISSSNFDKHPVSADDWDCSASKPPYQFFSDAGQLTQTMLVKSVQNSPYMCMKCCIRTTVCVGIFHGMKLCYVKSVIFPEALSNT